jgi:thiamine biosynthesis protein ThiC
MAQTVRLPHLRLESIIDATDKARNEELKLFGSLVKRAWKEMSRL